MRRAELPRPTRAKSLACWANQESSPRIQLYRGDKEMLLSSMKRIHRTAGEIIRGIGVGEGITLGSAVPPHEQVGVAACHTSVLAA